MHSSSRNSEELEPCVICGELTHELRSTHIDYRSGYIEGFGQICIKCNYTEKKEVGMMEFS